MLLIQNAHMKTMAGADIPNGCLLVENGKIAAVAPVIDAPAGAKVIDAQGRLLTPGCVEAHCHIGLDNQAMRWEGMDYNEIVDPLTPQLRAIDSINPQDEAFGLALRGGVTTACTGPGSANVVGGTFAILKLAGKRVDKMVLRSPAAMKCAFGENPKGCYGQGKKQSPMTRMAVAGLLRELQGPEAAEEMIERPSFMAETPARMTGTERGTAYHRAMQLLELAPLRALGVRDCTRAITDQLDAFAAGGRMEEAQRAAVSPAAIARFCCGDTGSRLLAADTVRREWPFNVMMRMSEALLPEEQGAQAEREILVQGAIDCCFVENGKWVLLDYKTDRNTDAEALTARYRSQLRLYALALERITGLPVADIRLCLLLGGEEISISGDADAD